MKKIKKSPFTDPMNGVRPKMPKRRDRSLKIGLGPRPPKDEWDEWRKLVREGKRGNR